MFGLYTGEPINSPDGSIFEADLWQGQSYYAPQTYSVGRVDGGGVAPVITPQFSAQANQSSVTQNLPAADQLADEVSAAPHVSNQGGDVAAYVENEPMRITVESGYSSSLGSLSQNTLLAGIGIIAAALILREII